MKSNQDVWHISQPVTEYLISRDWVPVSIKKWWYSEPPAVNDLRVGSTFGVIIVVVAIAVSW
ncbi:MAG: hypothetical protein AAB779_03610 [Patescibacteria group bacterium]